MNYEQFDPNSFSSADDGSSTVQSEPVEIEWMWKEAADVPVLGFLAQLNPLRWSRGEPQQIASELESQTQEKPVLLKIAGQDSATLSFAFGFDSNRKTLWRNCISNRIRMLCFGNVHSFVRSFPLPSVRSSVHHAFVRLFVRPFVCSFVSSCVRLFICL